MVSETWYKSISDDRRWCAMALQRLLHKGEGRSFVPGRGDLALEDLARVLGRPSIVHHLAVELHVHLVEMPTTVPKIAHVADAPSTDLAGEEGTEPIPPQAHGLVAKILTALEQQVLDIPQRQREPDVKHYHLTD